MTEAGDEVRDPNPAGRDLGARGWRRSRQQERWRQKRQVKVVAPAAIKGGGVRFEELGISSSGGGHVGLVLAGKKVSDLTIRGWSV